MKNINESKYFCLAPWISFHIWPDGNVYPCCLWDSSKPIGNISNNTLEDIWNSKKMKDTRLRMLDDKPITECSRCNLVEKTAGYSYRNRINDHHKNTISIVDKTNHDGTLDDINLHLWDIRISNFCNFKCRSCGPDLSSSWVAEQKKQGLINKENKDVISISDRTELMDVLSEHFKYVDEIYFAGGEPLLMPEHYDILNKLIEIGKTDVNIRYSTNFSKLTYKGVHIFEYWKHFSNLELYISVDGIGRRGEYIRNGFDTNTFIENVKQFLNSGLSYKSFGYSPTYGVLNYLHLFDLILEFYKNGLLGKTDDDLILILNPITEPLFYDCSILPDNIKNIFYSRLSQYDTELKKIKVSDKLINIIIKKLKEVYDFSLKENTNIEHNLEMFNKITDILDGYRNESFLNIFPELKSIKK